MIKKILSPTDRIRVATNTATYACKLAKIASANLTLLHVLKAQDAPTNYQDAIEASLRMECKSLSKAHGITCICEMEPGINDFNDWVVHRSQFFDLLVLGSNGADTMEQLLLDSPSFNVIKRTTVPLMVIPQKFEFKSITRIIYAYDYKSKKMPPLGQLQEFASLFNTKVSFLTIVEKYAPEIEDEMDNLNSLIHLKWSRSSGITFDYVYYPDVVKSLNHYYQMWSDSDLLVLSAEHHRFINQSFNKSVIREITNMANYPVLVVHE